MHNNDNKYRYSKPAIPLDQAITLIQNGRVFNYSGLIEMNPGSMRTGLVFRLIILQCWFLQYIVFLIAIYLDWHFNGRQTIVLSLNMTGAA